MQILVEANEPTNCGQNLEEVYLGYYSWLISIAPEMIGRTPIEPEDLVQILFLTLSKRGIGCLGEVNRASLRRHLRQRAIDAHRFYSRKQRDARATDSFGNIDEAREGKGSEIYQIVEEHEARLKLTDAIRALRPRLNVLRERITLRAMVRSLREEASSDLEVLADKLTASEWGKMLPTDGRTLSDEAARTFVKKELGRRRRKVRMKLRSVWGDDEDREGPADQPLGPKGPIVGPVSDGSASLKQAAATLAGCCSTFNF